MSTSDSGSSSKKEKEKKKSKRKLSKLRFGSRRPTHSVSGDLSARGEPLQFEDFYKVVDVVPSGDPTDISYSIDGLNSGRRTGSSCGDLPPLSPASSAPFSLSLDYSREKVAKFFGDDYVPECGTKHGYATQPAHVKQHKLTRRFGETVPHIDDPNVADSSRYTSSSMESLNETDDEYSADRNAAQELQKKQRAKALRMQKFFGQAFDVEIEEHNIILPVQPTIKPKKSRKSVGSSSVGAGQEEPTSVPGSDEHIQSQPSTIDGIKLNKFFGHRIALKMSVSPRKSSHDDNSFVTSLEFSRDSHSNGEEQLAGNYRRRSRSFAHLDFSPPITIHPTYSKAVIESESSSTSSSFASRSFKSYVSSPAATPTNGFLITKGTIYAVHPPGVHMSSGSQLESLPSLQNLQRNIASSSSGEHHNSSHLPSQSTLPLVLAGSSVGCNICNTVIMETIENQAANSSELPKDNGQDEAQNRENKASYPPLQSPTATPQKLFASHRGGYQVSPQSDSTSNETPYISTSPPEKHRTRSKSFEPKSSEEDEESYSADQLRMEHVKASQRAKKLRRLLGETVSEEAAGIQFAPQPQTVNLTKLGKHFGVGVAVEHASIPSLNGTSLEEDADSPCEYQGSDPSDSEAHRENRRNVRLKAFFGSQDIALGTPDSSEPQFESIAASNLSSEDQ